MWDVAGFICLNDLKRGRGGGGEVREERGEERSKESRTQYSPPSRSHSLLSYSYLPLSSPSLLARPFSPPALTLLYNPSFPLSSLFTFIAFTKE